MLQTVPFVQNSSSLFYFCLFSVCWSSIDRKNGHKARYRERESEFSGAIHRKRERNRSEKLKWQWGFGDGFSQYICCSLWLFRVRIMCEYWYSLMSSSYYYYFFQIRKLSDCKFWFCRWDILHQPNLALWKTLICLIQRFIGLFIYVYSSCSTLVKLHLWENNYLSFAVLSLRIHSDDWCNDRCNHKWAHCWFCWPERGRNKGQ